MGITRKSAATAKQQPPPPKPPKPINPAFNRSTRSKGKGKAPEEDPPPQVAASPPPLPTPVLPAPPATKKVQLYSNGRPMRATLGDKAAQVEVQANLEAQSKKATVPGEGEQEARK